MLEYVKYYLLFTPNRGLQLFTHQAEGIGLYQLCKRDRGYLNSKTIFFNVMALIVGYNIRSTI